MAEASNGEPTGRFSQQPAIFDLFAELIHGVRRVSLIAVARVDALHVDLAIIHLVSESRLKQRLDLGVADRAALHGKEVVLAVNEAPIDHRSQLFAKDAVEPDARGAAVAFSEGVGDVHLDVLLDNLVEGGLGHFIDGGKRGIEVHHRGEAEVPLGDVDRANLARKIVNVLKEVTVDGAQALEVADLEGCEQAVFKQLECT